MSATAKWYGKARGNALKGNIKVGTNDIAAAWLKSTHVPDILVDEIFTDVSADEASGTGYTSGGSTVTSPGTPLVAANSFGKVAATTTAYTVGQVVRPTTPNGFVYRCVVAGTSGSAEPAWPIVYGETVTDGTVTWECLASAISSFTGDVPTWAGLTCSDFQYLVFYDKVTGYLICIYDSGAKQAITAQDVTYNGDDDLGIVYDGIRG